MRSESRNKALLVFGTAIFIVVIAFACISLQFANKLKSSSDNQSSQFSYDLTAQYTTYYGAFSPIESVFVQNEYMMTHYTELTESDSLYYITSSHDEEKAKELMEIVTELSNSICDGIEDDKEKVYAIAMWVGTNVAYDEDASTSMVDLTVTSIEAVIENGYRTTCAGFSNLFTALCSTQGYYCLNLKGGTSSDGYKRSELDIAPTNHEWCAVLVDDEWIYVDPTWISDYSYSNGEYIPASIIKKFYASFGFCEMGIEHRIDRCEHRIY